MIHGNTTNSFGGQFCGSETLVVLSDESFSYLSQIEKFWPKDNITVGKSFDTVATTTPTTTVILNWSGSRDLLRDVFLRSPRLQWVHSRSASLERSLFAEIVRSSVVLTNGSGVFSPSLAEFAIAAILYFAKDLRRMVRNQIKGIWEPFDVLLASSQTVGVVGYGDIGRQVAARASALGMKVLATKRHVSLVGSDTLAEHVYGADALLEMIPRCDYLVACLPLTEETRGMIGEREINAMRSDAVIINLGRGPVIREQALLEALTSHRIKGAALDVFDQEPLPAGHPLYELENVLLSALCRPYLDLAGRCALFF